MTINQSGFDLTQSNVIKSIKVSIGGEVVEGSYYVEGGIIATMIGNKIFRCPVNSVSVADTVKAIVTEVAMTMRS